MVVVAAVRAEAAVAIGAAAMAVAAAAEAVVVAAAETAAAAAMAMTMAGGERDDRERRPEGGIGGSPFANSVPHIHVYQFVFYLHICIFYMHTWRGPKFSQINVTLYMPQIDFYLCANRKIVILYVYLHIRTKKSPIYRSEGTF
jgi:hypothetical protein